MIYKVDIEAYGDRDVFLFESLDDALAHIEELLKGDNCLDNISLFRQIPFSVDFKVSVD